MPLFSIIIPVYNTEKYLNKCVKSVINQKHKNTEIILVDDCSTDNSLSVCNSFRQQPLVNIIRNKKNVGVAMSRNNGIFAAKGKYILFLDSDDWLYPGSLKGLENLIIKKPKTEVIIGKFNSDGFPSNNKILFRGNNPKTFNGDQFISFVNKLNFRPMVIWHYIVKKSLIKNKKLYFIDVKNGEDEEYGARLLCSMKFLSLYQKNYYWHRTRKKGGLRYSMDLKSTESYLKVFLEYYKFIRKKTLSYSKQRFIESCIKFAAGEFSARVILHNKKEIKKLSSNLKNYPTIPKTTSHKIRNNKLYVSLKNKKNILHHKEIVTENILKKLSTTKFKFKEIFIYCAAVHGVATLNILKKNKFKVTSLVDDNLVLEKKVFLNVNVISGKKFLKKIEKKRSEILVIVCQQSNEVFGKISNKLKLKGIKSNQIIHIIY